MVTELDIVEIQATTDMRVKLKFYVLGYYIDWKSMPKLTYLFALCRECKQPIVDSYIVELNNITKYNPNLDIYVYQAHQFLKTTMTKRNNSAITLCCWNIDGLTPQKLSAVSKTAAIAKASIVMISEAHIGDDQQKM